MCLGVGVTLGCHGKETDEVIAGLRADNQQLRAEVAAVRAENAVLVEGAGGPRWPATVSLKRAGGNSGRMMFARECPAGQALKGFSGKTGSVIDALTPVCTPVVQVPGTKGVRTLERELPMVGGRGGRAAETVCPGQTLMIGVRGRSADVVDALEPVCEQGKAGPRIGGAGGRDYERMCPVGWVAVGLTGRQGDYVEAVSLTCADPRELPGYVAPAPTHPPQHDADEGGPPDVRRRFEPGAMRDAKPADTDGAGGDAPAERPEGPAVIDADAPEAPAMPDTEVPPEAPTGRGNTTP